MKQLVVEILGNTVMRVLTEEPAQVVLHDLDLSGPESVTTFEATVVQDLDERVERLKKLQGALFVFTAADHLVTTEPVRFYLVTDDGWVEVDRDEFFEDTDKRRRNGRQA